MDENICRWILEFLLRKPIPDDVLERALLVWLLPDQDSRFKKTLLLRSIQSEIKDGSSVSETVLQKLELIEELDFIDGIAIPDSMKVAYCAVAVSCTLKYVGGGEGIEGEYFDAVKRIWRGKVEKMEGKSGLFTEELGMWRDDIEAAVLDEDVRRDLWEKKWNAADNAWSSVQSYLEEAWAIMGPSFIESVAMEMRGNQGSSIESQLIDRFVGARASSEPNLSSNLGGNDNGRVEVAAHIVNPGEQKGLGDLKVPDKVGERAASELDSIRDLGGNDPDRVELAAQMVNQGGVQGFRDHQVSDMVGEGAASLHDSGQVLGVNSDRVKVTSQMVNQKELLGLEDQQVVDNAVKRVASLHDSGQDLGGSEGGRFGLAAKAMNLEQDQELGNKQVGDNVGKMVVKSLRKKHTAHCRRIGKGVENVDSEDSGSDMSCSKLELQAEMVKDSLPDDVSETVRCELQKKNMNDKVSSANQNGVGASIPDIERTVEPVQAKEANMLNQVNSARPSLTERNSTACTFEWDDSIDSDLPEGMSSEGMKRIHLPSPKKIICSPLKTLDATKIAKRRKIMRWTQLEEDTLRTGVHRFGRGNWKIILNHYRDIFEERTEVDLKDKWRNMISN